ncbi:hypothetical protein EJ08DRAFT_631048 [Tothia fuscella]|uniref:N-acetylgalactosaminide beta-1,3-galactosyltransferase n=1 Tax=Tothia fuscella TaxID=1048955 RepID=A0A9P4NV56_9PEZI|nr:hypothetical protein EJ08DRAFT_631048 [Tothia fuscella]
MKSDEIMTVIHQPFLNASRFSRRQRLLFVPLVVLVFLVIFWHTSDTFRTETEILIEEWTPLYSGPPPTKYFQHDPSCSNLPGANKTVLVLKTGASEVEKRLPIHFQTTFKCTPNFLIFSDMNQTFHGHTIHDALDEMHLHLPHDDDDLKYYNSLQAGGREGKNLTGFETSKAWSLDRYKNIPMLKKTYAMYPEAEWFIFIDADTSILFSSTLKYLSNLNPKTPLYFGSTAIIAEFPFAHGGSGYVISNGAAKRLVEVSEEDSDKHYRDAKDICCGDGNIAHALDDVGVQVARVWPNFNGATVQTADFDKQLWCWGSLTWHHMAVEDIERMWWYERDMMSMNITPTYKDIFQHFSTHINKTLQNWDNDSHDETLNKDTANISNSTYLTQPGCAQACYEKQKCMQYRFKEGECVLQWSIRLGKEDKKEGYISGWMLDRIEELRNDMEEECSEGVRWRIPESKLKGVFRKGGKDKDGGKWVT